MTQNDLSDANENSFVLTINRLPGVSFRCRRVATPGVTAPSTIVTGSEVNAPVPSGKHEFDVLTVQFIMDEDYANWKEIFKWMLDIRTSLPDEIVSDVTVVATNSHGNNGTAWRYLNAWPTSLDPVDLDAGSSEVVICGLSFLYSDVEVEDA